MTNHSSKVMKSKTRCLESCLTCVLIAKLSADYPRSAIIQEVVTDCPPHSCIADLYPSLCIRGPVRQPNLTVWTTEFWSRIINQKKMNKNTKHKCLYVTIFPPPSERHLHPLPVRGTLISSPTSSRLPDAPPPTPHPPPTPILSCRYGSCATVPGQSNSSLPSGHSGTPLQNSPGTQAKSRPLPPLPL